jgi:HK97 gp10 family phage protein
MATRIEIKGLDQAKENFKQLGADVQGEIGRQSLRALGWALGEPMRQATYTTFTRRTGAIGASIGVNIQYEVKSGTITGYVEAKPTPLTLKAGKRRGKTEGDYIPFYWLFLERGTGPRRAKPTPKFLRTGRPTRSGRVYLMRLKSVNRWAKSASRGAIEARTWLLPAFDSAKVKAVDAFRDTIKKLVETAISAMPK